MSGSIVQKTDSGSVASARPSAIVLRPFAPCVPAALTIAASTGGLEALQTVLEGAGPYLSKVPVFIVLHMPTGFTNAVTNQIVHATGLQTRAPAHGERVQPGHIYVAPANIHMRLLRVGDTPIICHADGPPENFCKPAADVLFRSAAQAYQSATLGIVLTGMGADGLAGSRAIVDAGGTVIVQDEASSVVWGMPGAVAAAGLASAVLPVQRIAPMITSLLMGLKARGAA
jgi:two-component system chemotaxis response regulator CheB